MKRWWHRIRWGHYPRPAFLQPEMCLTCTSRDYFRRHPLD